MSFALDECPYRRTAETICEEEGAEVKHIPPQGICDISYNREQPCGYPFDTSQCPQLNKLDFCDFTWAQDWPQNDY